MDKMNNPYDEPCPLYAAMIEIGLCSDTTDVVDGAVVESLIAPDLKRHGYPECLTEEQREICRNCTRRELM